jgi:hypothetical protein
VASYREKFLTASLPPAAKRAAIEPVAIHELRAEVSRRLDAAADAELRRVLAARDKQLRRIEFDLETELSRTIAAGSRDIHSAGEVRN